jgi:hypothetical protein
LPVLSLDKTPISAIRPLTSRGSLPKPALRAGVNEKGENCRG